MINEEIIANESYHACGRITLEEIKQAIHKLDLISKPYGLYANPSDVAIVKDLIPDNIKLVETPYVEKGKFYLMDRKHFEDAFLRFEDTFLRLEDKECEIYPMF